jgi:hypothetical protein
MVVRGGGGCYCTEGANSPPPEGWGAAPGFERPENARRFQRERADRPTGKG